MAENEQDPALTCPPLPLKRILGYNGNVKNGLHVVEGDSYPSIIYPLGSACIKECLNPRDPSQAFFRGHSNPVSAVVVSPCGKFLASGQVTHMGYKAAVHVYTIEDQSLYATFTLHKVTYLYWLYHKAVTKLIAYSYILYNFYTNRFWLGENRGSLLLMRFKVVILIGRSRRWVRCCMGFGDETINLW